eukprot:1691754-Ditylum_brightwellii.AAC.1
MILQDSRAVATISDSEVPNGKSRTPAGKASNLNIARNAASNTKTALAHKTRNTSAPLGILDTGKMALQAHGGV